MKAHELKNYWKSFIEMSRAMPMEALQGISQSSFRIIKERLGFFKRFRVMRAMGKEKKRFLYANLFDVKEKGLKDERFLMTIVRKAAYFYGLSKVLGKERAIEIDRELTAASAQLRLSHTVPPAEDLLKCDDPFAALKEWLIAFLKANKSAGIYEYEISENSEKALQIKCLYCAFDTINRIVDEKDSTLSACYFEDTLFSHWDQALGIKYTRNGALAKGDNCCRFRFEYTGT